MKASDTSIGKIGKSQMPPLHQKRILAFVNHFLINSCTFLNGFAETCETRFIQVERKLQKIEAALTIIEAKLSSIPDLDAILNNNNTLNNGFDNKNEMKPIASEDDDVSINSNENNNNNGKIINEGDCSETSSEQPCEDSPYIKYFKMLQVGVPLSAVKLKVKLEGLDPNVLDKPSMKIPAAVPQGSS